MNTLEEKLARLEAIEAIRNLKARYLACCDEKNPEGVRACFMDGPVRIEYGAIGSFSNADDLVAVYTEIACHPHMLEMHHGSNPRIDLVDTRTAEGSWSLHYQLINTQDMTLTQIGGDYLDEYRLTDDGWKMSATRFSASSTLVLKLDAAALQMVFTGRKPPVPEAA